MSKRPKHEWIVILENGLLEVSCPVCGRIYTVPDKDYFRICPECGQQLSDREIITAIDIANNEQKRKAKNEEG